MISVFSYTPFHSILLLAFVGLECVSIELDDPYGNDVSDSPGCCRLFLTYAALPWCPSFSSHRSFVFNRRMILTFLD